MRVQYYDIARLSEERADDLGVRFALFENCCGPPTSSRCMCR